MMIFVTWRKCNTLITTLFGMAVSSQQEDIQKLKLATLGDVSWDWLPLIFNR